MKNKKISSSIIVCLIALSLLIVGTSAQTIEDGRIKEFTFEDGRATLTIYGAAEGVTATGFPTYNYPPLPPPSDDQQPEIIGAQIASVTEEISEEYPSWDLRVFGEFDHATVGLKWEGEGYPLVEMWKIDLIRGDINQDGTVDCEDLKILIKAYGSSQYSRIRYLRIRYNPDCDLNNDHKVNLRDLYILFRHLGQTAQWTQLEDVAFIEGMIYAYNVQDFSIFRCR